MTFWFGESWGAPICDPERHEKTPVGKPCLYCGYPIEPEDNGVIMPHGHADGTATVEGAHRLCFLETVLGHGPECERCRGLQTWNHLPECAYAKRSGECDCSHGEEMRRLLDATTTLAEVREMAKRVGISNAEMEDIGRRGLELVEDLKRRRATHNPGDDPGKRKGA